MEVRWGIAIVLSGLVAGGALNNAVAMVPALRRLGADQEVRPAINVVADPALTGLATVAGIVGLVLLAVDDDAPVGLTIAGLAALLVAEMALFGASRTGAAAGRWDGLQLTAAAASVAAFTCLVVAAGPG